MLCQISLCWNQISVDQQRKSDDPESKKNKKNNYFIILTKQAPTCICTYLFDSVWKSFPEDVL